MAESKLEKMMLAEKETLTKRREEIIAELATVDGELNKILRYFGEAPAPARTRATSSNASKAPRGENLARIKEILAKTPDGMKRDDVLRGLGVKGDKKAESAISQALMNAKKNKHIGYDENTKKYLAA